MACNGDPSMKSGISIYRYACNQPMENTAFYSADGEMLIVPEQGGLTI